MPVSRSADQLVGHEGWRAIARLYKVGSELSDVLGGGVDISVANVVPGEPIRVTWRAVLGVGGTATRMRSRCRAGIEDRERAPGMFAQLILTMFASCHAGRGEQTFQAGARLGAVSGSAVAFASRN
jgi:hypothetical protein